MGKVPPSVFVPQAPRRLGARCVVRRESVRVDPALVGEEDSFAVIRTAFGQRRKMLRRSLAEWATEGVFERAGVDATRRPEELTLEEFAALAAAR